MESLQKPINPKPRFALPASFASKEPAASNDSLANPTSVLALMPAGDTEANAPATAAKINSLADQPFALDRAKPLDPASFPNQPLIPDGQILPTIANFQYLLRAYKIAVRYNVIKKKVQVTIRGHMGSFDNKDNVLLTQITSIAALNGFPTSQISNLLVAVADRELYNPVADWILSQA